MIISDIFTTETFRLVKNLQVITNFMEKKYG